MGHGQVLELLRPDASLSKLATVCSTSAELLHPSNRPLQERPVQAFRAVLMCESGVGVSFCCCSCCPAVHLFGVVRSLKAFRLTGGNKDYLIVGSDSGRCASFSNPAVPASGSLDLPLPPCGRVAASPSCSTTPTQTRWKRSTWKPLGNPGVVASCRANTWRLTPKGVPS